MQINNLHLNCCYTHSSSVRKREVDYNPALFFGEAKKPETPDDSFLKNLVLQIISILPSFLQKITTKILNFLFPNWLTPSKSIHKTNEISSQTAESKPVKITVKTEEDKVTNIPVKKTVSTEETTASSVKKDDEILPKEPVDITSEAGPEINDKIAKNFFASTFFPGDWKNDVKESFKETDGSAYDIDMISKTTSCRYFRFGKERFEAIEIPYGDGNLNMVIMLPDQNSDITRLRLGMTPDKLKKWLDGDLDDPKIPAAKSLIKLPSFTSNSEESLSNLLKQTGILSDYVKEQYTKSDDKEETGNPRITLEINRPFLFIIRDNQTKKAMCHGMIKDFKLP